MEIPDLVKAIPTYDSPELAFQTQLLHKDRNEH